PSVSVPTVEARAAVNDAVTLAVAGTSRVGASTAATLLVMTTRRTLPVPVEAVLLTPPLFVDVVARNTEPVPTSPRQNTVPLPSSHGTLPAVAPQSPMNTAVNCVETSAPVIVDAPLRKVVPLVVR